MAIVPSCHCVITFVGIPVTPDVNKIILCDDSMQDFNSALYGVRIATHADSDFLDCKSR